MQRAGLRSSAVRGGVPECKVCGAVRTLRGWRRAPQGTNRSPAGENGRRRGGGAKGWRTRSRVAATEVVDPSTYKPCP